MSLSHRKPFKFVDDDSDRQVLDEQEQDELIQELRDQNAAYDKQYLHFLQAIVVLSLLLHLIYFFNPTGHTPVQVVWPDGEDEPIPLPRVFVFIDIFLHLNLTMLLHPAELQTHLERLDFGRNLQPLSYQLSYVMAAVAPTLCLFLGRSWSTIFWWSMTAAVIFTVHTAQDSINQGNESISSLEAMKYTAPGA